MASAHTIGAAPACSTSDATISFDFAGASSARCVIEGPRRFALVISPEHAPPINPSPWYAFRYRTAAGGGPVHVRLDYLGAEHRYAPLLMRDGKANPVPVAIAPDRRSATLALPAGGGIVSARPILDSAHYTSLIVDLAQHFGGERVVIGQSLDGRAIEGLRLGDPSAPQAIVILGRQHPPEVTGSYALEPFLRTLAQRLSADPALARRFQILAVPLLNPDGVDRGHWRANRGGVDLNRDWGPFTQPETRAVRDWLAREMLHATPLVMIDFHSTNRNLFYVQGSEAAPASRRFLEHFLGGKEHSFAGYPFTIEPRNANPGSGTAKNWFFACFAIPSYTYEVSDEADRQATAAAARALAGDLVPALDQLAAEEPPERRSCLAMPNG